MKKFLIIPFILIAFISKGQYVLSQDTTISTTWSLGTKILKVNPGVMIHGTGTVSGGYIDASYFQNIFDSTVNVSIKGGTYNVVSTTWFGTSPSNKNNSFYFQKAINATANTSNTLYTPSGVYNDSSFLIVQSIVGGSYSAVTLHWKGDYRYNGALSGTVINCVNPGNFALGIQYGKGVIIEGLAIQGKFRPPTNTGVSYYNITYNNYMDTTCSQYYTGVIVDPYANQNGSLSGSTGILFKDMSVSGFTTLFKISPAGTANGEEIIAQRINFGNGRVGWLSGQPQEKQNVIENSMAWGGLYVFFKTYYQSGNYHIHDINVAGGVVQLFDIGESGWFSTSIDNIYAESIGRIGNLTTSTTGTSPAQGMGIHISNSIFAFAYIAEAGNQYLCVSNSLAINFNNCDFTYFGDASTMVFNGLASYDRCTFSGPFANAVTGSTFTSTCKFMN